MSLTPTPSLPISSLISVNVQLSAQAAQAQNLNQLLFLGSSPVIDPTKRMRSYPSLAAVGLDFSSNDPEYLAATLWFDQVPQPSNFLIGLWAKTAVAGQLFGGPISAANQSIALWQAVTAGGFLVSINGVPTAITGLNFSADANMNAVAATIQAALPASCTCVWNSTYNRFVIGSSTTGVGSTVSFVTPSAAVGHVAFSANPAANDTLTIDGTLITFVSGTPSAGQVELGTGGSAEATTIANLLAYLNASMDANIVKMKYSVIGTTLYCVSILGGVTGNAYTLAAVSTAITLSAATLAGGEADDISAMLVMTNTAGNGAYVAPGVAAESALAAVEVLDTLYGQQWFALSIAGAADSDHQAVAAYIEAGSNQHFYGVTTQEGGVITPGDTTDIAYVLQQSGYERTAVQYSSSSLYAAVSLLARILTTDYTGNNTVITLMWKQEPGITAETLNATQMAALLAKNCNVFVNYNNNTAIIQPGICSGGQFIDSVIGALALAVDLQTAAYNLLYTSATKIPQTDAGVAQITNAMAAVCTQYVNDGLGAPGVWTGPLFGALSNDSQGNPPTLSKGFYIYAPPVASQSAAARAARVSPLIQIGFKLAGAVHKADVSVIVNQ